MLSFCNVFELVTLVVREQLVAVSLFYSVTTIMSVLTPVSSYLFILYSAYNDETAVK